VIERGQGEEQRRGRRLKEGREKSREGMDQRGRRG
jgi:hypothetical protein